MSFEFGDIVLLPFPFSDQSGGKRRPAAVASGTEYNSSRPDIVVVAITSQLRPTKGFGEVWLGGWQGAGLIKPSVIKPVFATIERGLV